MPRKDTGGALEKQRAPSPQDKEDRMLYYTIVFLIIAIIAGVLGFGVIAFAAAGVAKLLFFLFLIAFLFTLIKHLTHRRVP